MKTAAQTELFTQEQKPPTESRKPTRFRNTGLAM